MDSKHSGEAKTIKFDLGEEGVYRLVLTDAVKLLSGQLNPMIAFTTGKIQAQGDVRALMALQGLRGN